MDCANADFRGVSPVVGQITQNGQFFIGSAVAPFLRAGHLTSIGGTIVVTEGPGTLNIDTVGGQAAESFPTNSGTAVPTAGVLNLLGAGSLATSGSGNTATFQLSGLTNHAVLVGAGTSTITKVGPTSTIGQVLQSAGASADPAFSTATYPLTTTINQILFSSAANTVTGLATANQSVLTTGATGVPVLTALATNGQLIIGSTAGVPAAATLTQGAGITITNGSNSITIATSGTNSTLPAFMVILGTTVSNVTGDDTNYNILFDTTLFDQNSNITLNSGGKTIFTAPKTGLYSLTYAFTSTNPGLSTRARQNIITTTKNYQSLLEASTNLTTTGGNMTGLFSMTSGDTAYCQVSYGGTTKTVNAYGDSAPQTYFSGYLVC